jgi:hypothetical protein
VLCVVCCVLCVVCCVLCVVCCVLCVVCCVLRVAASRDDDKIAWYRNSGAEWTANNVSIAVDGAHAALAVDVDNDGWIDVISGAQVCVSSLISTLVHRSYLAPPSSLERIMTMLCCACAPTTCVQFGSPTVVWHRNSGSGAAWTAHPISAPSAAGAISLAAVDVDGDGRLDVFAALSSGLVWYRNGGTSLWMSVAVFEARPMFVFPADVDGDGFVDIVACYNPTDKIILHRNSGVSNAWAAITLSESFVDAPRWLHAGDLNGDGSIDILSASSDNNMIAAFLNSMCPRGTFGPSGYAPCSVCPPGRFSASSAQSSCGPCPSGRFGFQTGLFNASCTGPCAPSHACPAGSVNATVVLCPAGTFSAGGAGSCTPCPAGVYGALSGLTSAACTAPCRPGSFGSAPSQTSPVCDGNCTAGYACAAGSTSPTTFLCPTGRYSTAGMGSCLACPAGTYGDSVGLTSSACSGPCAEGYVCPPGSNSSTPVLSCPVGRYGEATTGACEDCPVGRFGPTAGATSPAACTACASGFFGDVGGLSSAQCSGVCPAGYFCQGAVKREPALLLKGCVCVSPWVPGPHALLLCGVRARPLFGVCSCHSFAGSLRQHHRVLPSRVRDTDCCDCRLFHGGNVCHQCNQCDGTGGGVPTRLVLLWRRAAPLPGRLFCRQQLANQRVRLPHVSRGWVLPRWVCGACALWQRCCVLSSGVRGPADGRRRVLHRRFCWQSGCACAVRPRPVLPRGWSDLRVSRGSLR